MYGTTRYGGMAWKNIQVVSLYEKPKLLIGSIRLQDTVGKMLWRYNYHGCNCTHRLTNLHRQLVENDIAVALSSIWLPTKQRVEDRVIMDVVIASLPSWIWAGVNSCWLYLQATTIADITTLDGTFIPDRVRRVHSKVRKQKLVFPMQTRPNKQAREQINYFLDFLSHNGHLHIKLGPWMRQPDQIYQYLYDGAVDVVYKRERNRWKVFGRKRNHCRRFRQLSWSVDVIPAEGVPIQVIEGSRYLITVEMDRYVPNNSSARRNNEMIEMADPAHSITGYYDI